MEQDLNYDPEGEVSRLAAAFELPTQGPVARKLDTWNAVALRRPDGMFLAPDTETVLHVIDSPYEAMWFPSEEDSRVWLARRNTHVRRMIDREGFRPVLGEFRIVPFDFDAADRSGLEHRPLVAEAATDA